MQMPLMNEFGDAGGNVFTRILMRFSPVSILTMSRGYRRLLAGFLRASTTLSSALFDQMENNGGSGVVASLCATKRASSIELPASARTSQNGNQTRQSENTCFKGKRRIVLQARKRVRRQKNGGRRSSESRRVERDSFEALPTM